MEPVIEDSPAEYTIQQKMKAVWNLPVDSATQLAMEFKSMLRFLQFFGSFPVYLVPKERQEMKWEFKAQRLSRQTVFPTLTSAIFFSLVWMTQIWAMVFGNLAAEKYEMFTNFTMPAGELMEKEGSSSSIMLGKLWEAFTYLIPIHILSTMVASWTDAPTFAKLFNEWIKLEMEFFDACSWTARGKKSVPKILEGLDESSVTLLGLPGWRKRYSFYLMVIPMAVVIPFYLYVNVTFKNILEDVRTGSMALHFVAYPFVNAMTAAIMYKCMACAFHQTTGAMASAVKSGQWDVALVSSWRCFIEKLREQCQLIAKAYTCTEFIYVGWVFVTSTIVIFTLFNGNRQVAGAANVMGVMAFYGIGNLLTLLIKVCAAELIAHEESTIASLVASVQTRDPFVLQELKFIHEMIATRPSEISVGNYVTMNRRLVLSLIGQISTYLIVLMQFSQVR